jgi:ribosomal protein S18 acetylase RimI-like enzyme
MTLPPAIELRRLTPEWKDSLAEFFSSLKQSGADRQFHPHPFTAAEAERRAGYDGLDLYYICVAGEQILAYAMLRGWDEGYSVPSLGIAVESSARGCGIGELMMTLLHVAARRRGALKIRLKVYRDNAAALRLYEKMGYRFDGEEGDQRIGILDLEPTIST